jgi:hypothetical protein
MSKLAKIGTTIVTCTPYLTKASAQPQPKPLLTPQTSADFPFRPKSTFCAYSLLKVKDDVYAIKATYRL